MVCWPPACAPARLSISPVFTLQYSKVSACLSPPHWPMRSEHGQASAAAATLILGRWLVASGGRSLECWSRAEDNALFVSWQCFALQASMGVWPLLASMTMVQCVGTASSQSERGTHSQLSSTQSTLLSVSHYIPLYPLYSLSIQAQSSDLLLTIEWHSQQWHNLTQSRVNITAQNQVRILFHWHPRHQVKPVMASNNIFPHCFKISVRIFYCLLWDNWLEIVWFEYEWPEHITSSHPTLGIVRTQRV